MDRMNPLDATFLHVEDGINHMHIASCAIFEGPAPQYEALVELFRSKLALVPRYRQKVRFVPGALGRPVWVDDPHFRLGYHIRHTALPAPGTDQDLCKLMGRLMSQELDRHRPLWETWMVEGLANGHWALISKIHHCMVDGVSGNDLMAVVLDASPEGSPPVEDHWAPKPEPSPTELVLEAVATSLASPYEMSRWLRASLRRPRRLLEEVTNVVQGARSIGGRLLPNAALSIEGTIGPHRRWTWASGSLDEIKKIRVAHGGTVNDVVLAAITNGFRQLLLGRGENLDGVVVRSLVPVSVRSSDDRTYNNQVSAMIAELPVGIEDPVDRLHSIRAHMSGLKESHQAEATTALFEMADFAPPLLFATGLHALAGIMRRLPQRGVNTVTTNVPGPQVPLYACGCEMLEYLPYVPLAQGVRTGVAILSYNRRVTFGITGDWDTVPDIDVLAKGIEEAIRELLKLSAPVTAKRPRSKHARVA
jgi:diacylglycerol O-acyltransferase